MRKVFVDTSAWIALLNEDDIWHEKAHEVRLELIRQNYHLVTSNFILLELADALCSVLSRQNTVEFICDLKLVKYLTIISLNDELFFAGITLYESRRDKDWGLTDCISFVIMQQEGITEALTTDKHFEQAGFIRLIK
jgi:predicted nucleic acid-binding protein